jgi:hypothetical protein
MVGARVGLAVGADVSGMALPEGAAVGANWAVAMGAPVSAFAAELVNMYWE